MVSKKIRWTFIYLESPYRRNVLIVEVNSVYNVEKGSALAGDHVLCLENMSIRNLNVMNIKRLYQ